ncbi:ABC transporter permease [Arthrobacter gyeryongensis]
MSSSLDAPALGNRIERLLAKPGSGLVALLILFIITMTFVAPSFLSLGNWENIANQAVFVLLLALGMTIVLIARGIDLSVGSVMGLSAGVAAFLINQGLIFPLALLAGIGCGLVCGLLNSLMITKLGLPDFVATLAMLGVARGVLFLWTKGTPFTRYMTAEYRIVGGQVKLGGIISVPIIVAIILCILVSLMLRKSVIGRYLYAIGGSPDAARLSGISVSKVKTFAYVVSGGCAGLAGVILAGRATNVAPTLGTGYEILAITAAIIGGAALTGGRGRMVGAVLGALTITLIANAMNIAGVTSEWQQVVTGIILLLAVLLDRITAYFKQRQNRAEIEPSPQQEQESAPSAMPKQALS